VQESEPLQEVLQGDWDSGTVMQLFADLAAGAVVTHVQLKTDEFDSEVPLATAKAAFAEGKAIAIQLRYRFAQELWCDTILPSGPTTRIVRTRVNNPSG
jgi:hypothetical protein